MWSSLLHKTKLEIPFSIFALLGTGGGGGGETPPLWLFEDISLATKDSETV